MEQAPPSGLLLKIYYPIINPRGGDYSVALLPEDKITKETEITLSLIPDVSEEDAGATVTILYGPHDHDTALLVLTVVTPNGQADVPFLKHFGPWSSADLIEQRRRKNLKTLLRPHVRDIMERAAELAEFLLDRWTQDEVDDGFDAEAVDTDFARVAKNRTTKSRRPTKKGNKKK
jgi:hypothetical protein